MQYLIFLSNVKNVVEGRLLLTTAVIQTLIPMDFSPEIVHPNILKMIFVRCKQVEDSPQINQVNNKQSLGPLWLKMKETLKDTM